MKKEAKKLVDIQTKYLEAIFRKNDLEKQLKAHWEATKEVREITHTKKMYETTLKKDVS